MLKGHAKIELTNVHTGEKEIIEHDNLITNAVEQIVNRAIITKGPSDVNSNFAPLINNGMGGIFLFENNLVEDKDNFQFPALNNTLTGYASNDVNSTDDKKRGSRNLTESMKLDNGYKYVWDFATSQANGTISAVALTNSANKTDVTDSSKDFPSCVYLESSYGSNVCGNLIDVDFTTYECTAILRDSTTIQIHSLDPTKLGLTNSIATPKVLSTHTITNLPTENSFKLLKISPAYNGYYYILCYQQLDKKNSFVLGRINANTFRYDSTFNHIILQNNITDVGLGAGDTPMNMVIYNGYIYTLPITKYNGSTFIKISLTDYTCEVIPMPIEKYVSSFLCEFNGKLLMDGYAYDPSSGTFEDAYVFNYESGYISSAERFFNNKSECIFGTVGYRQNITYACMLNYLATINNLDTPVTKTADKTMKITYTITET